jgi:thioredoxin-related protein
MIARLLRTCALALAFTLAAGSAGAQEIAIPAWFKHSFLDLREDAREAAAQRRHLMLFFHQNGCPYCKRMVDETFRDPQVAAAMKKGFDTVDINIFGSREVTGLDGKVAGERDYAALLKVRGTPTIVFLDAQSRTALRLSGFQPPKTFLAALDYVASGASRSEPDFQRYLKSR